MTILDYYFRDLQEIADNTRTPPQGIALTETEPLQRAAQLQEQIMRMGVPEFVRRCAQQDGEQLPQELLDSYREEDLLAALQAITAQLPDEAPKQGPDPAAPPQIDEPDGPRSVYEVLLDCCCLDQKLMLYFIDILKRNAEEEFQKLALVTTRKAFTQRDLLYWLGTKEQRESREALICVTVMDACFDRLAAEGEKELIAALICGDQTTFELFRCEAPELKHLPEATFEWYEEHYLKGYYPLRYMMKFNGISFPKEV